MEYNFVIYDRQMNKKATMRISLVFEDCVIVEMFFLEQMILAGII